MGWNDRPPNPLDPATDPLLPQADTSQDHDIPTGVSPTTAKLQDWIAWLRENGVFYLTAGVIANDITVSGNLTVTGTLQASGATNLGSTLAVGGAVSAPRVVLNGTQPASNADPGANTLHSTNAPKCWAYVESDGGGGVTVHDAFNLNTAAVSGLSIRLTFARSFSSSLYAVTAVTANTASFAVINGTNAGHVDIGCYSVLGGALTDPASNHVHLHVAVFGRQ